MSQHFYERGKQKLRGGPRKKRHAKRESSRAKTSSSFHRFKRKHGHFFPRHAEEEEEEEEASAYFDGWADFFFLFSFLFWKDLKAGGTDTHAPVAIAKALGLIQYARSFASGSGSSSSSACVSAITTPRVCWADKAQGERERERGDKRKMTRDGNTTTTHTHTQLSSAEKRVSGRDRRGVTKNRHH